MCCSPCSDPPVKAAGSLDRKRLHLLVFFSTPFLLFASTYSFSSHPLSSSSPPPTHLLLNPFPPPRLNLPPFTATSTNSIAHNMGTYSPCTTHVNTPIITLLAHTDTNPGSMAHTPTDTQVGTPWTVGRHSQGRTITTARDHCATEPCVALQPHGFCDARAVDARPATHAPPIAR